MTDTAKQIRKELARLQLGKRLSKFSNVDVDDALGALGLQKRVDPAGRFLTGVGLVLGGVVIGAVLGMMLAPSSGEELRRSFAERRNGAHAPGTPLS